MKVEIKYPHVMINTVEIQIPDNLEIEGLTDEGIVDVLRTYDDQLAGFENPDYHLLDKVIDSGVTNQFSIKESGSPLRDLDDYLGIH